MDTIIVLNSSRQVIDILSNNGSDPSAPFFDDIFRSELDTGAETYEFTTLANPRTSITLEIGNYILFKYNGKYKLFQIMETTDEHTEGKKLLTCYCEMAGMELLNDYCEPFTVEGNFITFLNTILQDTNWQVGLYSASLLDNIQTVTTTDYENVYKLIQDNLATFGGVEIEFRAEFVGNQLVALLIDCYEAGTRGNRTYRRFEYGEDVKGITRERNINDLATAVIGIGKNGLEFKDVEWKKINGNPCDKPLQQNFVVDVEANDLWNNGGKYIKTTYKSDTEDPYTLIQETWDYLQEIKQPKFDYDVDLALVAEDYRDISIGDTNYVVDFDYNPPILLEARVGTLELSFSNPNDNKCILTNYKELTSILSQPVDLNTVGNMIQSHFPIQGTDIAMGAIGEGHINVTYYQAIKADIVQAGLAEVGTLIADKADITDLNALNADIENLRATKAEIDDLNATNGNITNLTSQVGNIETLLAGNATAGNVQSIHLTSANAVIDDAVIKNAMIDTVSGNKVNTGTLNTNNVNIESEDGGIKISGATQQFKDKEGHVRVQIGKDASGNFTFCLFSQDGVGILLDETGIKAGAVPDGLIVNDMVADNANISGNKIDIASVITNINNNTTSIKSSAIKFDDTGQSLLVAFNELKNTVDTIEEVTISGDLSSVIEKVNTHTTQIGIMQGEISSLIQNTTITKQDGTVVQLKDAYNQTVSKVDGNTTKIGTLETNYNKVTGDIESVTDRTTTLETNLSGVTARVTQNETDISSAKSTVSQHTTDISGIKSSITSLESTTEDHTTRLTTVENNITKEAIVNKISDTFATTDTVGDIESRVQTAEQTLTKDGITNIVGDYYADGATTRNALTRIEQKADSVTTTVSNIKIGGRNLLKNTQFEGAIGETKTCPNWTFDAGSQVYGLQGTGKYNAQNAIYIEPKHDATETSIHQMISADILPKNTTITVSGTMAGESNVLGYEVWLKYYTSEGKLSEEKIVDTSNGYGYFEKTTTTPNVDYTEVKYQIFHKGVTALSNGAYLLIPKNLMVEVGTKASNWQPAPEDMASKSVVTQTADQVRFDFKHQGTANLQRNGNGGTYNHDGWLNWKSEWYHGDACPGYIVHAKDGSGCVQAPYIRCAPNTTYSVKVHVCPEVNTGNFQVNIKQLKSSDSSYQNYKVIWGADTQKGWHTVRATFTTDAEIDGFHVELWSDGRKSTEGNYVTFFSELMVFQGAEYFPDNYVPYTGGIYGNTTTIDDSGVTVYMDNASNQNARATLNYDGLTIFGGNGSKRAWFGESDSAFIDRIMCNKIDEPTLIKNNINSPVNLYCAPNATGDGTGRDPNNRASSISNALEWLRSTYGCYTYKKDIKIWLASGDYWGAENYIGGWIGSGSIWINFDQWACLREPVVIEDSTMTVLLVGTVSPWDYNTQNNAYIYLGNVNAIRVRNAKVILGGINIQKEGWGGQKGTWDNYQASCICAEKGARVLVSFCDIVGFWNTVYAIDMSVVTINDCRGHCHTRGDIDSGSILIRNLGYPICADATYYHGGGSAIGSHDKENNSFFAPKPDAPYTPPPAPTENWQWTENTWNASSLWTTPEGSGSGTTARSGCWGQGSWSSYKAHRGHASFDGVNAWCNGGRNFSVYITMHRLNTNHGNAGATPVPKFVRTDGASWSCGQAFARGDTKTIQLPWEVVANLIQGGTNELQLWAGKSTSDYSFYDNVSLRIVCEKNFI